MIKNKLQINQLNTKLQAFAALPTVPSSGWINAIRTTLGVSLIQMGKRLGITRQSVAEIEQREADGSITLKNMHDAAQALDMRFVYGLVPIDGSLELLIDRRAKEIATKIVLRTSHSMTLEDQANSEARIQKAIEERADELKRERSKLLWD